MEDSVTPAAKKEAPSLSSLKAMFEDSAQLTQTGRVQARIDRDYFDGAQWTSEEKAALAARKQPDNVFNRIRPAIEGTVGVIEQGQTDPKAWPRNPGDEEGAQTVTEILRYIEDKADFDQTKTESALGYFIEGIAAVVVELDEDRDVQVTQVRYEEFFFDPRSRAKDFSDARYLGVAKWRYSDEIAADFPDKKADIDRCIDAGSAATVDDTFKDRPEGGSPNVAWTDKKKRRVMQVELYHKEAGEWFRCVYFSGGVLEYEKSAYLDTKGRTRCPIIAVSCYIDRENNRYGKVRDMRGPQDEINKRRSKLLHTVSSSQTQARDADMAMATDVETVRKEAAKPDGVLPPGWEKVSTTDMAAGQANLLAEAKSEIERMGPNPAMLGRQGADSSGRAQLVRQQAGMTELAPVLGVFDRFVLRVYRAMWETARQFWDAPMFIRVTDDEGAPQFIGLNQPKGEPVIDPMTGQPVIDPQTGQPVEGPPALDPMTGQPLNYKNRVAEMDVDITIDTTPDTANVAQEQFLALVELVKAGVQIPPDVLIQSSSLPKKAEILKQLKAKAEQPNPQAEIAQADAVAKIEKTKSEAALNAAKTDDIQLSGVLGAYAAGQASGGDDGSGSPPAMAA